MTLTSTNSSGGGAEATRAEMTGPEIKTGRTFWKLYVALFLIMVAALAVVAGTMLSDSAEKPAVPAGSATEPIPVESSATSESTAPEPEVTAPAAEPEPAAEVPGQTRNDTVPESLVLAQNSAAEPVKIGDIYQDADGVWRNRPSPPANTATSEFYQDENGVWHNRQPAPARTQAAGQNLDLGGLLGQMLNPAGRTESASSAPMDIFGGLMSSEGLDLGGLFNSAGGFESLGLGDILGVNAGQESGDISSLFQMMETVLGGSGDLTGLAPVEAMPRANVISSGAALYNLPPASSAPAAAGDGSGLRLDGYERFDPATAGKIESEWEFFDGSGGGSHR